MEWSISKVASEDTIFLLDVSRSMFRADLLGKSRFYWALITIKEIIEKKHKIDPQDRYSLIMYSDKHTELEKYEYNFAGILNYLKEYVEISGKTQLPLEVAVKSIINEKRKIGQKIFRIIIVSDGYIYPTISNPIKFAKLANDLGIICDAVRYGKGTISGNILKRVVELTGGAYYYVQSEDEYFEVIKNAAEKKKVKVATILDEHKEDTSDQMSKDIAAPLLKMDDLTEDKLSQINMEDLKCAICHSGQCLTCETGFFGCGRFCPNCLKPLHLHCGIKWAESQSQKNHSNNEDENYKVLRCPFCYFLLKIPIMQIEKVHKEKSSGENIIKKIRYSDEISELMTSVCASPDCGIMFDESLDKYVYKCQACKSFFHEDCFLKAFSKNAKCPYCGCDSTCLDK